MSGDPAAPVPRATYRVQFGGGFGFADATALVGHLVALGVSHLYASPYLKARPGSTHGYDVVDPNALNPELGTEADFAALCAALRAAGMGQVIDFVPNHTGVGGAENPIWQEILEWGRDAPRAGYLDIDWDTDRRYLQGKILVPFLGDQYGAVLEAGDLRIRFDAAHGSFAIWAYGTHALPVCPRDYPAVLGDGHPELERLSDGFAGLAYHHPHEIRRASDLKATLAARVAADRTVHLAVESALSALNGRPGEPDTWRALDALIGRQNWRIASFRVAADDINYRRFFNINDLAGLRMEQREVFDATHVWLAARLADGTLDGVRLDHVDGLLDPADYFRRLRALSARPFWLVVEKILARHERLRDDWPVDGTTGYEFATLVGGLFVDPAAEGPLTDAYARFTGRNEPFEDIVRAAKIRIMETEMASELNVLARAAGRICRSHWRTADFTVNVLHAALKEIVARFPVYRTYVDASGCGEIDRRDIDWAVAHARRAAPLLDPSVFDIVHRMLTGDLVARPRSGYGREAVLNFAMRVQQYSGPVMAKGLEDTAFYRWNRLVALNEVGGHPDHAGTSVAVFHAANAERLRRWPDAMLATATHDTKRGEDTRARLYALSEMVPEWERQAGQWSRILRARRGDMNGTAPPDRNDEWLFFQLLLGAWPAALTGVAPETIGQGALDDLATRIEGAMIKAVREAKIHSTWAAPDAAYEEGVTATVRDALDLGRRNPFLEAFVPFQARLARIGLVNGLAQTLLKLTVPGVPDIYRGAEAWDLSLVDPDNRRAVDFAALAGLMRDADAVGPSLAPLLARWADGAVKIGLITRTLRLRAERAALFARGAYRPLTVEGPNADRIVAFARGEGDDAVLVAVPRLVGGLGEAPDWSGTRIVNPTGGRSTGGHWQHLFTGARVDDALEAAALFAEFPVALLAR
jgi:(1->4)-alpha-D-glucan 1-alpha-D-glucosylmutase